MMDYPEPNELGLDSIGLYVIKVSRGESRVFKSTRALGPIPMGGFIGESRNWSSIEVGQKSDIMSLLIRAAHPIGGWLDSPWGREQFTVLPIGLVRRGGAMGASGREAD
ncbi:hypothetical protein G9A89_000266, partial [Geosiphon pyriformis]